MGDLCAAAKIFNLNPDLVSLPGDMVAESNHSSALLTPAMPTELTFNLVASTLLRLPYDAIVGTYYDHAKQQAWSQQHWYYSIYMALGYIVLTFTGQELMRHRKPFNLRLLLAAWSTALAVFSFFGTFYMLPELIRTLATKGFRHSICNSTYAEDPTILYWTWLFMWSKAIEFGDTAFIVLRKQKLIALHWFHHALTVISCFYWYGEVAASVRWFASLNFGVHTVMYSYYALRAMRVRVPKIVAVAITTSQIVQMVVGFSINYFLYRSKIRGDQCDITLPAARLGIVGYSTLFVLFLNFFVSNYLSSTKAKGIQARSSGGKKMD